MPASIGSTSSTYASRYAIAFILMVTAALAIVSLVTRVGVTREDIQWLMLTSAAPEAIAAAGAIGEPPEFPVSP